MPYHVHLNQFDGPLDLLLHLIEKAEVDIKDIFVSEITNQYLEYMRQVESLDMDTASEFLTMAATLVYIKSRSLMPRPIKDDGEEEDPEVVLLRQLKEYKAFKEISGELQALKDSADGRYTKLPEEFLLPPQIVEWEGSTLDGLYSAFCEVLLRAEKEPFVHPLHQVKAEQFTIRKVSKRIRELLSEKQNVDFYELFGSTAEKMEIIVTFMSMLEMLLRDEICVKQSEPFGPITISAVNLLHDDDEIYYMDEEEQSEGADYAAK